MNAIGYAGCGDECYWLTRSKAECHRVTRKFGVRVYLDEFGGLDAVGGVCAVRDHGLWEEELQTKGHPHVNTLFVSTLQCPAIGRYGLTQLIMWLPHSLSPVSVVGEVCVCGR